MTRADAGAMASLIETLRSPLDALPDPLVLQPLPGPFQVSIRPPGSKSLTNRALVLGGLARGASYVRAPLLEAEDAQVMIEAMRRLGATIGLMNREGDHDLLRIEGVAGKPRGAGRIDLRDSGTAVRFLTAVAALANGETIIDGSARMRQRPIGGLVAALQQMRARIEFLERAGFPPLRVNPPAVGARLTGGTLRLPAQVSSQFLSALLMIAPWTLEGLSLELESAPVSAPYLRMTLALLKRLGAANVVESEDLTHIMVAPGALQAFNLEIEPDASGATSFWAAAALIPGSRCVIEGISDESLQGDAHFPSLLKHVGAETDYGARSAAVSSFLTERLSPIEADLRDMPDAAMTMAAVACFADGPSRLTGLQTLPLKECNRLAATATELSKLGATVTTSPDAMSIEPPKQFTEEPIVFETYNDHRMAMALSLIGLRRPGVAIANPRCVAKTYPTYWNDLARLYEAALDRL